MTYPIINGYSRRNDSNDDYGDVMVYEYSVRINYDNSRSVNRKAVTITVSISGYKPNTTIELYIDNVLEGSITTNNRGNNKGTDIILKLTRQTYFYNLGGFGEKVNLDVSKSPRTGIISRYDWKSPRKRIELRYR